MLTLVSDCQSLNEAAHVLGVRQSTLSRSVQRLEKQFGCTLLDRSPKGVALTTEGQRVLREARKTLTRFEALQLEFAESTEQAAGEVRVGSVATAGVVLLPRVLRSIQQRHPRVQVSVWEGDLEMLVSKVAQGELDVAITDGPVHREALVSVRLWTESYVVAMHRGHRLSARTSPLPLTDLVSETFVSFPGGVSQRVVQAACERHRKRPKFAHFSNNLESIRHNVESGIGVALLPGILMHELAKWNVHVVPVLSDDLHRTAVLISRSRSNVSRSVRLVHAEIQAHARAVREELMQEGAYVSAGV